MAEPGPGPHRSLARRFIERFGGRIRDRFNAAVIPYSRIGDPEVFEPERFDWTRELEQHWKVVRDEADAACGLGRGVPPLGDISPDHRRLDHQRKWRVFFLRGYGVRIDRNCRRCPRTTAMVERIPGLLTAMISIHEPGAHLPRHRGVTKGFLTCHLGLHIPGDRTACRIEVEGQRHGWREGGWFIFDDTRFHEVWNDSDRSRAILLLHVRRPLRAPGRWLQELFFAGIRRSPFIRDVERGLAAWEQRHDDAAAGAAPADGGATRSADAVS